MRKKILTLLVFSMIVGLSSYALIKNSNEISSESVYKVCQNDEKCYKVEMEILFDKKGLEPTLRVLGMLAKKHGTEVNCHNIAHDLGAYAYEKKGSKMLKTNIAFCSEGFNHGIINAASLKIPAEQYGKLFAKYCKLEKGPAMGCTHGIGHVIAKKDYNGDNAEALCREIEELMGISKNDPTEKPRFMEDLSGNCIDGWAMEQIDKIGLTFPGDTTVVIFCQGLSGIDHAFCKNEYFRSKLNHNYSLEKLNEYASNCYNEVESSLAEICGFYLGQSLQEKTSNYSKEDGSELFNQICQSGGNIEFQSNCVLGFITKKINYNIKPEENLYFCENLNKNLKNLCFNEINNFNQSVGGR